MWHCYTNQVWNDEKTISFKCTPLTLIAVNWYREEGERLYQMGKMICH